MTEYTVSAYLSSNSNNHHFGPFRSRSEAERTVSNLAALGKYQDINIIVEEIEEEEEE